MVGVPAGGAAPSEDVHRRRLLQPWSGRIVLVAVMALLAVALTETETLTLDSSLSPWLANFTVMVAVGRPRDAVDHARRLGLQRDGADARAHQPVAVQARRRPAPELPCWRRRSCRGRVATVVGASHEMSVMKRLPAICWPLDVVLVERVLDERRHALGVDHVGGEEVPASRRRSC